MTRPAIDICDQSGTLRIDDVWVNDRPVDDKLSEDVDEFIIWDESGQAIVNDQPAFRSTVPKPVTIRNCSDLTIHVDTKLLRVLIHDCRNLTIYFSRNLIGYIEIFRTHDSHININECEVPIIWIEDSHNLSLTQSPNKQIYLIHHVLDSTISTRGGSHKLNTGLFDMNMRYMYSVSDDMHRVCLGINDLRHCMPYMNMR